MKTNIKEPLAGTTSKNKNQWCNSNMFHLHCTRNSPSVVLWSLGGLVKLFWVKSTSLTPKLACQGQRLLLYWLLRETIKKFLISSNLTKLIKSGNLGIASFHSFIAKSNISSISRELFCHRKSVQGNVRKKFYIELLRTYENLRAEILDNVCVTDSERERWSVKVM